MKKEYYNFDTLLSKFYATKYAPRSKYELAILINFPH